MPSTRCRGCNREFPTSQGLSGHYTRNPDCQQEMEKQLANHPRRLLPRRSNKTPPPPLPAASRRSPTPAPLPHEASPPPTVADYPPPPTIPSKRPRTTVEDFDEGEDDERSSTEQHPTAGRIFQGDYATTWALRRERDRKEHRAPWAPFQSLDEWELARWLLQSELSQKDMDKYLKLRIVSSLSLIAVIQRLTLSQPGRLRPVQRRHSALSGSF